MAKVLHLDKSRSSKTSSKTKKSQHPHYQKALELYWAGRGEEAASHASGYISEHFGDPSTWSHYRLWIEHLCERQERGSLRALGKHLFNLSRAFPGEPSLLALRGLIHLELDEMEACQLLAPTLQRFSKDPFSQEFSFRYSLRQDGKPFKTAKLESIDYFFWQGSAQRLMLLGEGAKLQALLSHVSELFPGAPLEPLYQTYLALDASNYSKALQHNGVLKKRFPKNASYWLLQGTIQLVLGSYKDAVKSLKRAVVLKNAQNRGEKDPVLYTLLAFGYRELSKLDVTSPYWKKSMLCLQHADALHKKWGVRSSEARAIYELQKQYAMEQANDALHRTQTPSQVWVVNLSPRRAFELATCDEESLEILYRPIGRKVKKHDLVLFISDDTSSSARSRLLAFYQVLSRPVTHSGPRPVSILKLIKRFEGPYGVQFDWSDMKEVGKGAYRLGWQNYETLQRTVAAEASAEEYWEMSQYFGKTS